MDSISIIIPIYNSEKTLHTSINSIINQTHTDWELILVDDGSTDSSVSICQEYEKKDNRIRLIKGEHKGASAARNRGIHEAKYDLIAFNDSDDLWLEDKLEKQIRKMQADAYGLVYCRYTYDAGNIKFYVPSKLVDRSDAEGEIFESLLDGNKIGTPTILTKKRVFDNVGGFDESLNSLEDWEFVLRVALKYKIGFLEESLVIADYRDDLGVNSNIYERLITTAFVMLKYGCYNNTSINKSFFEHLKSLPIIEQKKFKSDYKEIYSNICFTEELVDVLNKERLIERGQKNFLARLVNPSDRRAFLQESGITIGTGVGIYGAGDFGRAIADLLTVLGYQVKCLYDVNIFFVQGYNVEAPNSIRTHCDIILNTVNVDINYLTSLGGKILNLYDYF